MSYAVLGNPISHSQSPTIHQLFAHQIQKPLTYTKILVQLNELASILNKLQAIHHGLNITAPFKEEAYTLVDQLTPRAIRAKAINTLTFLPDGSRIGDNTDGIGFLRDLKQNLNITIKDKTILLLGAGGAIRGILELLLNERPTRVIISNRTPEKILTLIKDFQDLGRLECFNIKHSPEFDIIINGVSGFDSLENMPPVQLSPAAICYEMSYHLSSHFEKWAKSNKNTIYYNGLGMLVEQAAEAFYNWHQFRPDTKSVISVLSQL